MFFLNNDLIYFDIAVAHKDGVIFCTIFEPFIVAAGWQREKEAGTSREEKGKSATSRRGERENQRQSSEREWIRWESDSCPNWGDASEWAAAAGANQAQR